MNIEELNSKMNFCLGRGFTLKVNSCKSRYNTVDLYFTLRQNHSDTTLKKHLLKRFPFGVKNGLLDGEYQRTISKISRVLGEYEVVDHGNGWITADFTLNKTHEH